MRAGRFSVSMLAISRSCLAKALVLRSVMSPSEPNTSKSRLNTSFNSRCQLFTEPGGHDHQRAVQFAPARKLAQDQRGLDRLAEADLVGDQETPRRRGGDPMGQHHLVRQQIDLGRGERRSALHHRKRMRLVGQPCSSRAFRAPFDGAQDSFGSRKLHAEC